MDKLQAIRGIAFDLDGTLVDSAPGLTRRLITPSTLELPVAGKSASSPGSATAPMS
jgi:phosphoglycolate phosphatase